MIERGKKKTKGFVLQKCHNLSLQNIPLSQSHCISQNSEVIN